jgi:dolichyl-phosphate-mannose-protein mannosyltransferase
MSVAAQSVPHVVSATRPDPFRPYLLPACLFLVALVHFTWRLWVPDAYMFDEVYHAYTAGQYAVGNADAYLWNTHPTRTGVAYMWNHPPCGILLIEAGIRLFGDDSFGWRIASAVFGALGVMIVYLLTFALTRRRSAALIAALLLLIDDLYFVQSRVGMLDVFGSVFMMCALWSFFDYLKAGPSRIGFSLVRTGVFLGLAIATKWNAAYASFLLGLVVLFRTGQFAVESRRATATPETRASLQAHLVALPIGFVLVPALIYMAAYVPFFLTGHDFAQWRELQKQILYYHSHLKATHAYQSRWWEWPLTLRPVWYYVSRATTELGGRVAHVYANGNFVLYPAFVPAVLWACARWWKTDRRALLVLAIGFFGQWLPWILVARIAFVYHFLPAAIFGSIAVAWAASELIQRGGWRRWVAIGYLGLVAASFAFFYPIRTAIPMTPHAIQQRMWFRRWN